MKLEVEWSRLALARLAEIQAFIALDNPDAAGRLAMRITAATAALSEYPHLGRPGVEPDSRELVIAGTPYVVAYRVIRSRVFIRTIWHGAQRRSIEG